MPVNTDSINTILAAYQQGLEESRSKRSEATSAKNRAEDIKIRQKELDDARKEREDQRKLENAREDAMSKVADSLRKANIAHENASRRESTGESPTGYEMSGTSPSISLGPGYATTRQTFHNEGDPNQPDFSSMEPLDAARLQMSQQQILQQPKFENEMALKKAEEEAKAKEAQKNDERDYLHQKELHKLDNDYKLEIAKLTKSNSQEDKLNTIIPPNLQRDMFGQQQFDPSLTYRSAVGMKMVKPLTPVQEDKLKSIQQLHDAALEAKQLLDKYGYNNYFKGGEGYIAGAKGKIAEQKRTFQGGMNDPTGAAIQNKLGSIADAVKKLNEGTAFAESEKPFLLSHTPAPFIDENPVTAEQKLKDFIKDQENLIRMTLGSVKSKPKEIEIDINGNEIVK